MLALWEICYLVSAQTWTFSPDSCLREKKCVCAYSSAPEIVHYSAWSLWSFDWLSSFDSILSEFRLLQYVIFSALKRLCASNLGTVSPFREKFPFMRFMP